MSCTTGVMHDQQEALAVSDLVVVMTDGRIAQKDTPTELYQDPADAFVADVMGEANVPTGEVTAAPGGPGRLQRAAFLGQTRECEVETAAGMLFIVTPAGRDPHAEGEAVTCRLDRVIPLRA